MEDLTTFFQKKNIYFSLQNLIYGSKTNLNSDSKNLCYVWILDNSNNKHLKIIKNKKYTQCFKFFQFKKIKIKLMNNITININSNKINFKYNKNFYYLKFNDIEITKSIFYSLLYLKVKLENENIFNWINNNFDRIKTSWAENNEKIICTDKNSIFNDFKYFCVKNMLNFENKKKIKFFKLIDIILENNIIDRENLFLKIFFENKINKFPKFVNKIDLFYYFNCIFFYGIKFSKLNNNLVDFDFLHNYIFKGIDMTKNYLDKDYKFTFSNWDNIIKNNYKVVRIVIKIFDNKKIMTNFNQDENIVSLESFLNYANKSVFKNSYFPFFIILKINKIESEVNINELFDLGNFNYVYFFKTLKKLPKLNSLFYKIIIILEFKENKFVNFKSLKSSESLKHFKKSNKKFNFNISSKDIFKSINENNKRKSNKNFFNTNLNINSKNWFKVFRINNLDRIDIHKVESILKIKSIKIKNFKLLKKILNNKISYFKPIKNYKEKNNIFNYLNLGISILLVPFKIQNNIYNIFNHCFFKENNNMGIINKNINHFYKKLALRVGILKGLNLRLINNNSKVNLIFYWNSNFIFKSKPINILNGQFNFSEFDNLNNELITNEIYNFKLNNDNFEFLQILIKDFDFNINYYMCYINIHNLKLGYSIFEIYSLKDEDFENEFGLIYLNIN